jgi:hypothetical protein
VHLVGSCYTDISRCTVNKTLNLSSILYLFHLLINFIAHFSIPITSVTQSLFTLLSKNYNLWFNYSVLYFTSNLLTTHNYLFTLTSSSFVLLFTLYSHLFYCKLCYPLLYLRLTKFYLYYSPH